MFSTLTAITDPQPQDITFAGQVDAHGHIHGPIGHLPVTDLGSGADFVISGVIIVSVCFKQTRRFDAAFVWCGG